jgi:hypothetical protein
MHVPDGTMQSRRMTRDPPGVRCTLLNMMYMFGSCLCSVASSTLVSRTGGWLPGGARRSSGLLGTTDNHARRERRASLGRRARGLLRSSHVSLCPAKTRMRENGGREEEGNCTVTVESRPESRGAYLCCSFFSCFAIHDVITSDTA